MAGQECTESCWWPRAVEARELSWLWPWLVLLMLHVQLLAPPESWLPSLEKKLQVLDGLTVRSDDGDDHRSLRERARAAYVQVRGNAGRAMTEGAQSSMLDLGLPS